MDYVTIEYGGSNLNGTNIGVTNGHLIARNSKIRSSLQDVVRFNSFSYGSLLNSQIVINTLYGVRNTQITRAVLATNNWWGDPSGPTSDLGCPASQRPPAIRAADGGRAVDLRR